jgi:hypothetical protein
MAVKSSSLGKNHPLTWEKSLLKETPMQYKTIVLQLLRQRPKMARQLRRNRTMLATAERYANKLKESHEAWKGILSRENPDSDPIQTTSEALERALHELENCLPVEPGRKPRAEPSLDQAMGFIRKHTPPA